MAEDRLDGTTLRGVPATALWTLRNRAVEAARADSDYEDPMAVELYERIDYPYGDFGPASQSHPLRAVTFDRAIRDYVGAHPGATVVALGEGLQTSFWRVGVPVAQWISVDLPEMIAVRERVFPAEERLRHVAVSALDRSWMDDVDPDAGVFISAEGLFMYLPPAEVYSLIRDCAARFPGGQLIFDSIPAWFSNRTMKGMTLARGSDYQAPPMPFHLSVAEAAELPIRIPRLRAVTDVDIAAGRGPWGSRAMKLLANAPVLKNARPSITLVDFE
ncbi:class I SAM-dependent methyltransferase [Nocardia sp. NPDC058176]|uniref:class I SAM-dependent methyltransferase n=1 Tax=Nocardia sp. NPDC058176 TaxID=3346368 RepID=UPI0036D868B6